MTSEGGAAQGRWGNGSESLDLGHFSGVRVFWHFLGGGAVAATAATAEAEALRSLGTSKKKKKKLGGGLKGRSDGRPLTRWLLTGRERAAQGTPPLTSAKGGSGRATFGPSQGELETPCGGGGAACVSGAVGGGETER